MVLSQSSWSGFSQKGRGQVLQSEAGSAGKGVQWL